MYVDQEAISFEDVAIVTQYSDIESRNDVDLSAPNHSYPIIVSPMYHTWTKEMAAFAVEKNIPFILHRYFPSVNDQIEAYLSITNFVPNDQKQIFVAVGSDEKWIGQCVLKGVKRFCVDMAHGNSKKAVDAVKFIKEYCPDATIMAGNIESYDGFRRLFDAGARYFRVGIGSGSICSTNINTGYGLPILTALNMVQRRMTNDERSSSYLIADGGVRTAADIAKALAFGADYVMCGKLFASTSKARGPFFSNEMHTVHKDGEKWNCLGNEVEPSFVEYAGMASKLMREMAGGSQKTNVSEEGKSGLIEYTGLTEDVFEQLINNLRAVLSYSGCRNIHEFKENATLRRIAPGGKLEKAIHLDKVYR